MDGNTLSPSQTAALQQLQTLTNGGDTDVAISVLESVEWDIQRAAEIIFDSAPSTSARRMEAFTIDDSEQGPLIGNTARSRTVPQTPLISRRSVFALITFPLSLLSNILRFLFGVLRIPLPRTFFSFNVFTTHRPGSTNKHFTDDPKSVVDRWIRSLEDETGAICLGRVDRSESTGIAGPSSAAANSSLRSRADAYENHRVLPDFYLGGYEEAMRACQKEWKIGCVVLVSEEHEDVGEFKRTTLTDPKFVNFLHSNNFLVWGGDIKNKDAWSTAQKLQATTYPFIAFTALQPRRSSLANSSPGSPVMSILSRHAGLSATTTDKLLSHLDDQLLPRVKPFLDRLKNEERRREGERKMREEQDRAYKEAMNRDKERIERKIKEEEERKRKAEEERLEQEKRIMIEEEVRAAAKLQEERRMLWRRYMRTLVKERSKGGTHRIGIRLPDGGRLIHLFNEEDTLTSLYAFVDAHLIPEDISPSGDPSSPPSSLIPSPLAPLQGESAIHNEIFNSLVSPQNWWGFQLALPYPRKEVPWREDVKIRSVAGLEPGSQLVVDMINNGQGSAKMGRTSDDYDTESDEE